MDCTGRRDRESSRRFMAIFGWSAAPAADRSKTTERCRSAFSRPVAIAQQYCGHTSSGSANRCFRKTCGSARLLFRPAMSFSSSAHPALSIRQPASLRSRKRQEHLWQKSISTGPRTRLLSISLYKDEPRTWCLCCYRPSIKGSTSSRVRITFAGEP